MTKTGALRLLLWLAMGMLFFYCIKGYLNRGKESGRDATFYTVEKKSFDLTIDERGIVGPARIAPIKSQISSNRAKIIWLIEEGTEAHEGLLVARFDPEPFVAQLEKAKQGYADAVATLQATQKALEIIKEEEAGKIEEAHRRLELAKTEAADILEGSGPLKKRELEHKQKQQQRRLSLARLELEDLEVLFKKDHISARERDRAKDAVSSAEEDLTLIDAEIKNFEAYIWPQMTRKAELLVSGGESDLKRIQRTAELMIQKGISELEKNRRLVRNQEIGVEKIQKDIANCKIYAPASGIVLYSLLPQATGKRKVQIGDPVWAGQTFLQIPDTNELIAEISVREVDVAKIEKGMEVDIEVDAFPDNTFNGKIESVASLAMEDRPDRGGRRFGTRVRFLGDTGNIRVGMSVTTEILYKKIVDVPVIPIRTIQYSNGKTAVQLVQNGQVAEKLITIGARGALLAEVKEGVEVGDSIEIPSN